MTLERAISDAEDRLRLAESGDLDRPLPVVLQEVVDRLQFIQDNAPDHVLLPYLTGRANILTGRGREGADKIQEFLRSREGRTNWHAHRLLGDLMVEQFPQLAKAHYGKAAALKDGEPTILYGLASAESRLGKRDDAIRYARDAVAADTRGAVRYYTLLAQLLLAGEEWAQAERVALDAITRAESDVLARPGSRTSTVVLDNQRKLVIHIMREWIAYGGVSADDYLRLSQYMRDRTESAKQIAAFDILGVLELAVSKYGENAPVALRLEYAIALGEVGRSEPAVAVLESIIESDPENARAKQWLQRLGGSATDEETSPID